MKSYWIYILASRTRVIYIGITGDLEGRLSTHREKQHPDSFTARYNCMRLVFVEEYTRVADALAREKELKGWRRAKKVRLIERSNPEWNDLAPPRCHPEA